MPDAPLFMFPCLAVVKEVRISIAGGRAFLNITGTVQPQIGNTINRGEELRLATDMPANIWEAFNEAMTKFFGESIQIVWNKEIAQNVRR
jgi:hypothetical protein